MYKKLLFLVLVSPLGLFAQNTYEDLVYVTLNTKCQNAACHSATSAESLKFDGTPTDVYASIYNKTPNTTAAAARKERLVWVNQPYDSYLLKRAASWLDTNLSIPASEADSVHTHCGVTTIEAEYIRQWIMNGAREAGRMIDTSIINSYYNDPNRGAFLPKAPRPAAGTGVQVRFGPIFVPATAGQNEVEYCLKHELLFDSDTVEVTSSAGDMNPQSHHFLLFRFDDSASANVSNIPNGMRRILLTSGNSSFDGNKKLSGCWQTNNTYDLPTGTAFFWPRQTWLDLNFHMKNYTAPGNSGIQPFDFYLNITTVPHVASSPTIEMKTKLVNNPGLIINPHSVKTIYYEDADNGTNEMRYIWMMSSHTHKMGILYNLYTKDASQPNSLGDTLYNGNYVYPQGGVGYDNGYYDWEHPSVEYFSPQRAVDFSHSGVIAKTTWKNDSNNIIHFGYTTADEMQLFYYMYTTRLASTTAVKDMKSSDFSFSVYPNPMSDHGTIMYTLDNTSTVKATIIDIAGSEVATLKEQKNAAGTYTMDMSSQSLAKGIYFARLNVNGSNYTKKFVVQ